MDGKCTFKNSQCKKLQDAFVRAMGATRFCEKDPIADGCLPENYPKAPGNKCFNNLSSGQAFVLDNSMIILTDNSNNSLRLFAVDVNGRKGPNKWGQDIFTFSVKANESTVIRGKDYITSMGIYPPSDCLPKDAGATKDSAEMLKEATNYTK